MNFKDIPSYLALGNRLEKPAMCTSHFYSLLLQCELLGLLEIVGIVGEFWRLLGLLESVEKCWRVLESVGECWNSFEVFVGAFVEVFVPVFHDIFVEVSIGVFVEAFVFS